MDVGEARGLLGVHWGAFQAAVNDPEVRAVPGGVQMYVWQSLRNDYLSRGESLPAGSFAAVNTLLSVAGRQRQAAANLAKAVDTYTRTGIDQALAANHLAADIDSRGLDAMPGGPSYRVRFESMFMVEGQPVFTRLTWDPGLALPQTVSELSAAIDEAAAIAAEDYGYEYGGVSAGFSISTI